MLKNSKTAPLFNNNKIIGNEGEDRVIAWLVQEGYTLIARNYRWRAGEIDIIARKNEIVAFVEVKAADHGDNGAIMRIQRDQ